jgi:hypothetical protein
MLSNEIQAPNSELRPKGLQNNRRRTLLFRLSLILNIVCLSIFINEYFEFKSHRLGVLKQDMEVRFFAGSDVLIRLPKGLTVRDASPQFLAAIGQFEPNRFSIVFTSDRANLVDYGLADSMLTPFKNELYSLDLHQVGINK